MKRRSYKWFTRFGLAGVVLAMLAGASAAVERPFKLRGTTQVFGNPFAPEGAQMAGVGEATHLGSWLNEGRLFFDAGSGPPFPVTVIVKFTAANGDELNIILSGTIDLSGNATATYYIVGGTGRFDGASGRGSFSGHTNSDGTLSYTAEGVINY